MLLDCGYRMMFVDNKPLARAFSKAHRQTESQVGLLAGTININAAPDRCRKSHIRTRSDLELVKIEDNRPRLSLVEGIPSRHIRIESARQEWRRHIEHQYVRIMIGSNSWEVFVSYGLCPIFEDLPKGGCIVI